MKAAPRAASLLAALSLSGCGFTPGLIHARWGQDPSAVAAKLRQPCPAWQARSESGGFESCPADSRFAIVALDRPATVSLIRQGDRLEAFTLHFQDCSAQSDALVAAVRREFALEPGDGNPYVIKMDDSLVHFDRRDCTLTVGGPRFGKPFASRLLGEGLAGLFRFR